MRWIRAFVRRHKMLVASGAVVVVGIGIFVLLWFQPQKLFIDKTVNEAAPAAVVDALASPSSTAARSPATPATASPATSARLVSRSQFISRGHHTSGRVLFYALPGGSHLLRLENLDTSNGPDLRVYLSPQDPNAPNDRLNDGALNIGHLKGNRGNQNYSVAAGIDVSAYTSVVIWCKRFSYAFGTASLG